MYFNNFRDKCGFSFLALVAVLLFFVAVTFGTAAASSKKNVGNEIFSSSLPNQSEKIEVTDSPIFDQFNTWVKSYVNNSYRADDEQMSFGEDLAIKREQLLKKLIQLDPQAALEKSVSADIYNQLPAAIAEHSEKRVSAYGDFLVFANCSREHSGAEAEESDAGHTVVIGDAKYKAFVYGRRTSMTTKLNIPLQGIVIGDVMAVDESPKRMLNAAERAVDNSRLSEDTIAAEVGGKVVNFSNQSELDNFVDEEVAWESKIGPVRPEKNAANGNFAPDETASAWTEGPKKILFMRVDFPDKTGDPISQAEVKSLYAKVNKFFQENSYGKTSLEVTVTQEVIHMPKKLTEYIQAGNDITMLIIMMSEDARNETFKKTGLDSKNFDFDVVGFSPTGGFGWLGQSLIGARGSLLNGDFLPPDVAHELGHNYGLQHAHSWKPTDGSIIGQQGNDDEYGDCFDEMAAFCGQTINSHFNAQYKHRLGWLPDENIKLVTASDTYTVFAQDSGSLGTVNRALKIRKNNDKNYWVEFKPSSNPSSGGNAANGALIHWDYRNKDFSETQLLDMNPPTSTFTDAALVPGQVFEDKESGNDYAIKITVTAVTLTSINVKVELTANTNCQYSLSPLETILSAAGGTESFTVTPSGANCPAWTAAVSNNTPWINIMGGNNITGNGTVSFSVMSNSGMSRDGLITVSGKTAIGQTFGEKIFTISQRAGTCTFTVNPSILNFTANGGTQSFALSSSPGCSTPTPSSVIGPYWIDATNNSITVAPYTGPARSGTVTVNVPNVNGFSESLTFTVNQASDTQTVCTYNLPVLSKSFSANAVTDSFNISSGSGCNWSAVSNDPWITITSSSTGNGNGTIGFSATANAATTGRSGTITVGGQTFTISQLAAARRKKILLSPISARLEN